MGMQVSDLEKAIREKAIKDARVQLQASLEQATKRFLPNREFYQVVQQSKDSIMRAFDEHCVKKVGDAAVGQFLVTYGNLVHEYPHLQAQLDEAQRGEGY